VRRRFVIITLSLCTLCVWACEERPAPMSSAGAATPPVAPDRTIDERLLDVQGRESWPTEHVKIWLDNPSLATTLTAPDGTTTAVHAWPANRHDYSVPMYRLDAGDTLYAMTWEEYAEVQTRLDRVALNAQRPSYDAPAAAAAADGETELAPPSEPGWVSVTNRLPGLTSVNRLRVLGVELFELDRAVSPYEIMRGRAICFRVRRGEPLRPGRISCETFRAWSGVRMVQVNLGRPTIPSQKSDDLLAEMIARVDPASTIPVLGARHGATFSPCGWIVCLSPRRSRYQADFEFAIDPDRQLATLTEAPIAPPIRRKAGRNSFRTLVTHDVILLVYVDPTTDAGGITELTELRYGHVVVPINPPVRVE